jgi:hypothetical protein
MELEELKRLRLVNARAVLSKSIEPLGTEYDVARDALVGMKTVRLATRELKLPGLERHSELVLQVLAEFKDKKKRNVMPSQYARADDIALLPLRPETFALDNFDVTAAAPGAVNVINPDGTPYEVDADNEIIVITDVVVADPTIITALQFTVDGVQQNPIELRTLQVGTEATRLGIAELDYPVVADASLLLQAKAESAGTTAVIPFGAHICMGRRIPGLT